MHAVQLFTWLPKLNSPSELGPEASVAVEHLQRGAARAKSRCVDRVSTDVFGAFSWDKLYPSEPSPFEPLLDLWAMGYVFDGWTTDTICLGAPIVERTV